MPPPLPCLQFSSRKILEAFKEIKMDMHLSRNFLLDEFTRSAKADEFNIDNTPTPKVMVNLAMLCKHVLEPLRSELGVPIIVTSGYRSPELNMAVGGAKYSLHTEGKAADIITPGFSLKEAFKIIDMKINYDKVIYEAGPGGNWIHVSYSHGSNRRIPLIASFRNGRAEYMRA